MRADGTPSPRAYDASIHCALTRTAQPLTRRTLGSNASRLTVQNGEDMPRAAAGSARRAVR
eukprot:5106436-Prymnesium_polylepis.2